MATIESILESGQPVLEEIHLLEPFIAATGAALTEMVGSEIGVRGMVRLATFQPWGDIAAVIGLSKNGPGADKQPVSGVRGQVSGARREKSGVRSQESGASDQPTDQNTLTPDPSPLTPSLILSFPQKTAMALAVRIMAGVNTEVDQNLIRDCMGEIANVVTGQAKAMLDVTPYRFAFALPPVVVDAQEIQRPPNFDCLMVGFTCDLGDFALQLSLES